MRKSLLSSAVIAALLPVVLMAQSHDSHAAHAAASASASHTITVTFSDYAFVNMPDTVPSGMVTLNGVNEGKEFHHAIVVRLDDGHTLAELMAGLRNPGPPPSWVHMLGGPQLGATVTVDLKPGNYALLCMVPSPDGVPHVMKGMAKAFTVIPSSASAEAAPKADIEMTMADYDWKLTQPLSAGRHTIKVTTAPGQPHEFLVARLLPGKSAKDIAAWESNMASPPPFDALTGSSPLEPGVANYVTIDLTPGRYALVCFLPDARDGKPHLAHGMLREVVVK